jgi:cytochrome b involved in lipid metabolism
MFMLGAWAAKLKKPSNAAHSHVAAHSTSAGTSGIHIKRLNRLLSGTMKNALLFAIASLTFLFGCTANPQDLAIAMNTSGGASANDLGGPNATQKGQGATNAILLTLAEVAKHNTASDCWMVIGGRVFDLTGYTSHPGGDTYVPYCGKNGTDAYYTIPQTGRSHSARADSILGDYEIGILGQSVNVSSARSGL